MLYVVSPSHSAEICDNNSCELGALKYMSHFGVEIRFQETVIIMSLFLFTHLNFSLHATAM
jgi:hypothetical protein